MYYISCFCQIRLFLLQHQAPSRSSPTKQKNIWRYRKDLQQNSLSGSERSWIYLPSSYSKNLQDGQLSHPKTYTSNVKQLSYSQYLTSNNSTNLSRYIPQWDNRSTRQQAKNFYNFCNQKNINYGCRPPPSMMADDIQTPSILSRKQVPKGTIHLFHTRMKKPIAAPVEKSQLGKMLSLTSFSIDISELHASRGLIRKVTF